MYCVKCRKFTDTSNVNYIVSKNGRNMARGKCVVCGTTKTKFVKKDGNVKKKAVQY